MNQAVPVFRHQFLSTTSGAAANLTSSAIPMRGNKAAVSVTIINVTTAGATLTAQVQGSYDGLAWEAISGLPPAAVRLATTTPPWGPTTTLTSASARRSRGRTSTCSSTQPSLPRNSRAAS